MFESMHFYAERYNRGVLPPEKSTAKMSDASGWVGVQGFLAGLVFNVLGLAAVAVFSNDENRARRTGWAIGGALTALGLVLLAV